MAPARGWPSCSSGPRLVPTPGSDTARRRSSRLEYKASLRTHKQGAARDHRDILISYGSNAGWLCNVVAVRPRRTAVRRRDFAARPTMRPWGPRQPSRPGRPADGPGHGMWRTAAVSKSCAPVVPKPGGPLRSTFVSRLARTGRRRWRATNDPVGTNSPPAHIGDVGGDVGPPRPDWGCLVFPAGYQIRHAESGHGVSVARVCRLSPASPVGDAHRPPE